MSRVFWSLIFALVIFLSAASASESPLSSKEEALLARLSSDDRALLAEIVKNKKKRQSLISLAPTKEVQTPKATLARLPSTTSDAVLPVSAPPIKQYSQCPGWVPLLRQDWKDIGIIAGKQCPDPVDKATGAQLSFADDAIAKNRIWTMHGTGALIYNSITGDAIEPYEKSAGMYVTVDRLINSSATAAKSNKDTIAYGGVGEIGFATSTGANYFQLRGGGVQDNQKGTTAGDIAFEWLPVYYPLHIHEPFQPFGLPIIVRFDPSLIAQYDGATGKGQLLAFNNKSDSLRLGPELALKLIALPGAPDWLTRFNALFTYRWAYETYSGARLDWFVGSVGYNLTDDGNIALNGTYKRGRDDTTGALTNIYTIGLNGKI